MVALRMREMDASDREWTLKMSVAMRLAHCPGALLAALEPFARHGVNLLKIESRPIHGRPWEYQFFLDLETPSTSAGAETLEAAFSEVGKATSQLRILGFYRARSSAPIQK